MEIRSTYKYARISPFKVREVTREIQGLPVSAALDLLAFTPKKAAFLIGKTLKSAIANAENNANLKPDGLVVKEATVGEGPTLKRIMARARGSASQILKRTSHIRIVLSDEIAVETRETRKAKRKAEKRAAKKDDAGEATQGAAAGVGSRVSEAEAGSRRPRNNHSKFMGQKVNPIGFRLNVNRDWRSRWYASPQEFPTFLHNDLKIRDYVKKKLQFAAVAKIVIERAWNSIRVTIHTARPGIVIGRKGAEIEKMTEEISKMADGKQVKIDIQEIKTPELDAQLVAENVALQIERRIAYRRAMKKAVQTAMDFGAEGIKLRSSGRLNGAEISRSEWYREGKIPLHTLRTPIDYGFAEANTVYGKIGVKCWICRKEERPAEPPPAPAAPPPPPPEPAEV